ncbi:MULTISPECIES: cell wall hydrolase [unclassified Romboutsia]|uniref:cell wall hydrolase n=1 Tax=unclassified Romboutsia TaxID=2626894 RepID=UPI00082332B2|nr:MULTISPECIES: cell wall hydrolase [unclassified Romboutsia]SCI31033.1 Spore cortex-lytic enzyme precursor [uncultured Clostridium sp.]
MDRCYKIIVSLLVFMCIIIGTSKGFAEGDDFEDKSIPAVKTNKKEERKAVINLTNEEILLLSKLVTSEARGESYEGQVAVAAVVINRVKDSRFPNSIEDVIYQKNAFSVVKNGSINMNPTDEAYKAAQAALYGEDPTEKAVYFWNPEISTCKWIQKLNPHMRIGNHVFAK